jgi:hypothetical protein
VSAEEDSWGPAILDDSMTTMNDNTCGLWRQTESGNGNVTAEKQTQINSANKEQLTSKECEASLCKGVDDTSPCRSSFALE